METVVFEHPKGIFDVIEHRGLSPLGAPYCWREAVFTPYKDRRGVLYSPERGGHHWDGNH